MKKIIITIMLLIHTAQAGWFSSDSDKIQQQLQQVQQHLQQTQEQLNRQQASTGTWQVATSSLAVSCILLFVIGAMLGSRTRRNGKQPDPSE